MEKKINIAELLKDCPQGMELDCTMFDDVTFDGISNGRTIVATRRTVNHTLYLDKYGCPLVHPKEDLKCVIFPKGKTTWEGFQRPIKDGDVVVDTLGGIHIMKDSTTSYCYFDRLGILDKTETSCVIVERLATEEEKQKLFQAIKDNGYKWNAETRTLIRPFRKSDWVIDKQGLVHQIKNVVENVTNHTFGYDIVGGGYFNDNSDVRLWTIQDAKDGDILFHSDSASNGIFIFKEILQRGTIQKVICYCDYDSEDGFCLGENHTCCWTDSKILHPATKEQCNLLFQKIKEAGYKWNSETKTLDKLIEPKFKVGDRIKKDKDYISGIITNISDDGSYKVEYQDGGVSYVYIAYQNEYELVHNKFDITILKPFDKVLVRDCNEDKWNIDFFSYYRDNGTYQCMTFTKNQCIPYGGNQHLLGTTDDCDEYYKTWEE